MATQIFNRDDTYGLSLVRTPPSEIPYTCDVIFVHGLNGGAAKTWRHPDGHIWFADFLPADVVDEDSWTNARIWTYGYDAETTFDTFNTSTDSARNLLYKVARIRERNETHKIIWVAHSLGGVLVKSTLVEAHIIPEYRSILAATIGAVFLGTPHTAGLTTTLGEVGAGVAIATMPQQSHSLVQNISRDSSGLFTLSLRFVNVCSSMKIYSLYEALPGSVGMKALDKASSVMNLREGETQIMLDGTNHLNMCKYRGLTDPNYMIVLDGIKRVLKLSSTLFDDSPSNPTSQHFGQPNYSQRGNGWEGFSNASTRSGAPSVVSDISSYAASYSSEDTRSTTPQSTFSYAPPPRPTSDAGGGDWRQYAREDPYGRPAPPSRQPYLNADPPAYPPRPASGTYSNPAFNSTTSPPPSNDPRARSGSSGNATGPPGYIPTTSYGNFPRDHAASTYNPYRPNPPGRPETNAPKPPQSSNSWPRTETTASMANTAPPPPPPRQESGAKQGTGTKPEEDSRNEWQCDGCLSYIYPFEARIHCLECPDYDLCSICEDKRKVTKGHKSSHRVELVLRSRMITQENKDLIFPSEKVHPQKSPGREYSNWKVEKETIFHFMSAQNDHARYLITKLEPGNYRVSVIPDFFLDPDFTQDHVKQLGDEPLGKLRIAVGFIKSKQLFFQQTFPEDMNLVSRLFADGFYGDFDVTPSAGAQIIPLKCILEVEGREDRDDIGVVFQWTDFRKFERSDKALMGFSFHSVRFEELLEYDKDFGGAADKAKRIVHYVDPPAPPPPGTGTNTTASDALSLADLLAGIMELAREEQDRQQQEALQQALREQLARRRQQEVEAREREAAAQLLNSYMLASQTGAELAILAEYLRWMGNQ